MQTIGTIGTWEDIEGLRNKAKYSIKKSEGKNKEIFEHFVV